MLDPVDLDRLLEVEIAPMDQELAAKKEEAAGMKQELAAMKEEEAGMK